MLLKACHVAVSQQERHAILTFACKYSKVVLFIFNDCIQFFFRIKTKWAKSKINLPLYTASSGFKALARSLRKCCFAFQTVLEEHHEKIIGTFDRAAERSRHRTRSRLFKLERHFRQHRSKLIIFPFDGLLIFIQFAQFHEWRFFGLQRQHRRHFVSL